MSTKDSAIDKERVRSSMNDTEANMLRAHTGLVTGDVRRLSDAVLMVSKVRCDLEQRLAAVLVPAPKDNGVREEPHAGIEIDFGVPMSHDLTHILACINEQRHFLESMLERLAL